MKIYFAVLSLTTILAGAAAQSQIVVTTTTSEDMSDTTVSSYHDDDTVNAPPEQQQLAGTPAPAMATDGTSSTPAPSAVGDVQTPMPASGDTEVPTQVPSPAEEGVTDDADGVGGNDNANTLESTSGAAGMFAAGKRTLAAAAVVGGALVVLGLC